MKSFYRALLVAGCAALGACSATAPTQLDRLRAELSANETRWHALGIHDYGIVTRSVPGFVVPSPRFDPMQVEVRADTIVSVVDTLTHTAVDKSYGATVEQLFAMAHSVLEQMPMLTGTMPPVTYDATYHFPTSIQSGFPDAGGEEAAKLQPR